MKLWSFFASETNKCINCVTLMYYYILIFRVQCSNYLFQKKYDLSALVTQLELVKPALLGTARRVYRQNHKWRRYRLQYAAIKRANLSLAPPRRCIAKVGEPNCVSYLITHRRASNDDSYLLLSLYLHQCVLNIKTKVFDNNVWVWERIDW